MPTDDRSRSVRHSWRPETRMVHGGVERSQFGETSESLFLTQGFVYASAEQAARRFTNEEPGFQYSRFGNPTVAMFEERVRMLEGADEARATATGMAAVNAALMCCLNAGDHVVASRAMFGSCRHIIENILPRFAIQSTLVDGRDLGAWERAIRPNTRVLFTETPANPTLELVDIAGVAGMARRIGARLMVDNVFATPMLQKPIALGADVVIYSATKHIDGQGRCLGGVVLGDAAFVKNHLHDYVRQTGPSLSPFNAWVMLKGLETLPIRVRAQSESARIIADHLAGRRPHVTRVLYPGRDDHPQIELARRQMAGGGQMIAFEVAGGKAGAFRFLNALRLVLISNNLGDTKSLITHPATTTHMRLTPAARDELGISDGLVRLSVGLEAAEDLIADLDEALEAAAAAA